jgi:flavin-binding protein dodecin
MGQNRGCCYDHEIGEGLVGRGSRSAQEMFMAKGQLETVYKVVDVVGVSEKSWEDAGRNAVETAAESLRDLRVAEVTRMDMKVENGKVTAFRTRVSLSFKYES